MRRGPETIALWLAAVGLSVGSAFAGLAMSLRGAWLREGHYGEGWVPFTSFASTCLTDPGSSACVFVTQTPVADALAWVVPCVLVATLLLRNRPLLTVFVVSRAALLCLDLVLVAQVAPIDRKGCEECVASAVFAMATEAPFVLALPWLWARRKWRAEPMTRSR